mgnify:CR=1 FL=1
MAAERWIRDQRKILDMTATSWLSFREFNGLLVYYTHLMSYRCAIREVRVGIDSAVPDKVLKMPPTMRPNFFNCVLSVKCELLFPIGVENIFLLFRFIDQEIPQDKIIHVRSHEAAVGILGSADDGFPAHIK